MANVAHSGLTAANLHEPKGAATAGVGSVYVADGAGSGSWHVFPHGAFSFVNIASPTTITYPASYTKVAPTTTAGGSPAEFTEATTARLTYTGTPDSHVHIACTISFDQAIGADRDIRFAIFKGGLIIATSETICTTVTSQKHMVTLHADLVLSTDEYLEVYTKNDGVSGDVRVYTINMSAVGFPEVV